MSIIGALPYTLTNGTTADANAVQANFAYIVSQVNANVQATIATAVLTALPVGSIIDWSGSTASIPAPWQICDGTNGTPDLRDKFLVGAGNAYAVGATGGATSNTPTITVAGHVLTVGEMPAHTHVDSGHTHVDSGHTHTDSGHTHIDSGHAHTWPEAITTGGTIGARSGPADGFNDGPTNSASANIQSSAANIQSSAANIQSSTANLQNTGGGGSHTHAGSSTAVPTLPPYYALAKIMKMS